MPYDVIEDARDKTGTSGNNSSLGDWAASKLRAVALIKYRYKDP